MVSILTQRVAVLIVVFFGGLTLLYGAGPFFEGNAYLRATVLSNTNYYDFIGFWFWLIILPITIFWVAASPIKKGRRGIHR